jgi:hypothetical protein
MKDYSFYHAETGAIYNNKFSTDDEMLVALNTPPDHVAIDGHHDHLSQRVDLKTGKIIDYQPPAPSTDHAWNDVTKRYQLSIAAQAIVDRRAAAVARIALLDAQSVRATRELCLARRLTADEIAAVVARLEKIDDEILLLRHDL